MPFKAIDPPKVADAVVDQIEELVAYSVLRPGEALPAERALAEQLGVSRASLRDALEMLVGRGVLSRRRGVGLIVADDVDSALSDPLERLIGARPDALDDYLSFRKVLEADAARRAAVSAATADLDRLRAIVAHMRSAHAAEEADRAGRLDAELHLAIAEASGNLVAAHVSRALRRALRQALRETRSAINERPGVTASILRQHEALVAAICARDPEAAAAASDAHLDFVAAELQASRQTAAQAARAALRPDRLEE